jgi:hypothetical protein
MVKRGKDNNGNGIEFKFEMQQTAKVQSIKNFESGNNLYDQIGKMSAQHFLI